MKLTFTHAGRKALREAISKTAFFERTIRRRGKLEQFDAMSMDELCEVARASKIDPVVFAKPNYTCSTVFDLKSAEAGATIATEDGRVAKLIGVFPTVRPDGDDVLVAIGPEQTPYWYREDGTPPEGAPGRTLVMVPQVTQMWVNLYPPGEEGRSLAHWFHTRELADRMAAADRLDCIDVQVPRS